MRFVIFWFFLLNCVNFPEIPMHAVLFGIDYAFLLCTNDWLISCNFLCWVVFIRVKLHLTCWGHQSSPYGNLSIVYSYYSFQKMKQQATSVRWLCVTRSYKICLDFTCRNDIYPMHQMFLVNRKLLISLVSKSSVVHSTINHIHAAINFMWITHVDGQSQSFLSNSILAGASCNPCDPRVASVLRSPPNHP